MKIQKDKVLHFAGCFVIALVVGLIFQSPVIGFALAVIIGMLKEFIDPFIGGVRDIEDFKADVGGATVAAFIVAMVCLVW